jgi:uncharacterized damage-inducible protein DinB
MTIPIDTLRLLLDRDLESLKREIEAYPDDAAIWATPPGIANSAGSLALHCAGNIQHYIGCCIGGSAYIRDRTAEFARRNVPRAEVLSELDKALAAVRDALSRVAPESVPNVFPDRIAGRSVGSEEFLVHLVAHLGYHIGQIDYHRRITTGDARTVNTVPVSELPERTA